MNILQAKDAVADQLSIVINKANNLFNLNMNPLLKSRKGNAAGSCICGSIDRIIKINFEMMILNRDNWDHILNETIPHEVAHMVEFELYNKLSHSLRWERICKSLGGNPKRCHQLKTATKKYVYNVNGSIIELSIRYHNKIQKGIVYSHRGIKILKTMFVEIRQEQKEC